jgi:ribosome-binding factor A
METTRQNKVSRLLQKDLGEIFQREGRNFFGATMITVTAVKISPDLSFARVYVSLFAVKDKEAYLEKIRSHTKEIRKILGTRIAKQVRIVPNLEFFIDDSLDHVFKIEDLLKKL